MPNFQNPMAFLLLLLIPLLFILRKLKIFNQISFPVVLSDWEGKHFSWQGKSQKILSVIVKILTAVSFCCCVIGFADPVITHQEKVYTSLGTDIVFVLDTSPSMAAKDVDGKRRIDAARNAINSLIQEYNGNRYGLVGFGSNASVIVPPTTDNKFFSDNLGKIEVGALGNGSAIGDGLSTAVCHLISSKAPVKCIVLLTDGENNAGEIHPETAAELSANNNIALYVVGVGSKGNVPIEYTDPITGKLYSGYLNSDYNFSSLRKIASSGNGRFFEVKSYSELASALNTVTKEEKTTQEFKYKTVNETFYDKFLLIAIVLILITLFIKGVFLKEFICFKYRKILIVQTVLIFLSFIMILTAYSGVSWGTYLVPIQKNSSAVSMVFDISNSMLAKDCPENNTRLDASKNLAKNLLKKMPGIPVSVVLAKGDGIATIPLTEDTAMIESLLEVMSPKMMTNPGTSLGKGLITAKNTFPGNFSSAGQIWLFTDGEETDKELTGALVECLQSGIPVTIIGFGSETESEIVAGDGKTVIKSALRAGNIEAAISGALDKYSFYKKHANIVYLDSTTKGAGILLLNQLNNYNSENLITSYEVKPVPRYKFFLLMAIVFFAFSYLITEFNFKTIFKQTGIMCVLLLSLSGCSSNTANIISGTYSWHQKNYKHAISDFMKVSENAIEMEDFETLDYALYDLGTSYLMIGEDEGAMEKFNSISSSAPDKVKYAAFYNAGIISFEKGNYTAAKDYFKEAIKVDNTKIEAKINLELSMEMSNGNVKEGQRKSIQANKEKDENPNVEDAIFQRIKENDKKQWKNSQSEEPQDLSQDY